MSGGGGRHSASRWTGRGRKRALLSLGGLVVLLIGSTTAYWTDEATITAGPIATGTLDLTAGTTTGAEQLVNPQSTWSSGLLAITDLVPNESIAATFVVRNSGSVPLRFNGTVRSSSNALTSASSGLQVNVYDNATTATNTGTQAAGTRSGTCNGSLVFSGYVSTTASGNVFPSDIALAATGVTRNVCLRAWLNSAAPNALQSGSTQVVLTLSAAQVNAP